MPSTICAHSITMLKAAYRRLQWPSPPSSATMTTCISYRPSDTNTKMLEKPPHQQGDLWIVQCHIWFCLWKSRRKLMCCSKLCINGILRSARIEVTTYRICIHSQHSRLWMAGYEGHWVSLAGGLHLSYKHLEEQVNKICFPLELRSLKAQVESSQWYES